VCAEERVSCRFFISKNKKKIHSVASMQGEKLKWKEGRS